ncbi:MAG: VOC family protein [Pyrinomonadaceae bacterium]|nr:VOC family protein [Pyrinomonadaceae bacterium]
MSNNNQSESLISPVKTVVMTVQNLNETRLFFEKGIGLKCIAEKETNVEEIGRIWGVEKGNFRVARFVRTDEKDFGCVDLVENNQAEKSIRNGNRPFDYGIFTLNFRTNNLEKAITILTELGAKTVSKPMTYNVGKPLHEVMFELPSGERLTILQLGEANEDLPVFSEPVATFGLISPSMKNSLRFYQDAFGMNLAMTFQHTGSPFNELLGISDEMSMGFAALNSGNNWMGKVELLELKITNQTPENTSEKADFFHRGYSFLTFLTKDIEQVKESCLENGAEIIVEPIEFNRPFHENKRAMVVRSPGGEYLEIIEGIFSNN